MGAPTPSARHVGFNPRGASYKPCSIGHSHKPHSWRIDIKAKPGELIR